jgi:hypothetical protein
MAVTFDQWTLQHPLMVNNVTSKRHEKENTLPSFGKGVYCNIIHLISLQKFNHWTLHGCDFDQWTMHGWKRCLLQHHPFNILTKIQ